MSIFHKRPKLNGNENASKFLQDDPLIEIHIKALELVANHVLSDSAETSLIALETAKVLLTTEEG